MYLAELRDALLTARGIDVDESTISRTLHRRGFSRKKVTRAALERNEELRNQFQLLVGANLTTEMLVFLDEAACNRHTFNRPYAWSPAQKRARRWDFFVRGQRSWTAESFEQYVDALLDEMNPYPMKNSVLVMDNAAQHHFDGLREMVEAR
ncbi:hypothetical protein BJ138DRAFT_1101579 [Hygrophoropsis aurantiaca]|uniref:Uncharacterized protein n=1 Tax=Hygrophoropsis aurantiaca TaxID=72124 RepID=A0ACB8ADD9_9AGAM|nr:hypothetical protein BJ138DRAFT_1101579 [Hygrophoropsis aurantiaca]